MSETETGEPFEADEVRAVLEQFAAQDWNRHTPNSYEAIEGFAKAVVEDGTFTPDVSVTMSLSLTPRERLAGRRDQDVTAMLIAGLALGAALERDVPAETDLADAWADGKFTLPGA